MSYLSEPEFFTEVTEWNMTGGTHLTGPERDEGAEGVASLNLGLAHLLERRAESGGERALGRRLDLDFGHLKRAQRNISEDLRGRGTREPDERLVLLRVLLAGQVTVRVLEDLVETVLEHTLERVADEGRAEAFPDTGGTLLSDEGLEARGEALVFGWVNLEMISC